jgi:hypothetical protein
MQAAKLRRLPAISVRACGLFGMLRVFLYGFGVNCPDIRNPSHCRDVRSARTHRQESGRALACFTSAGLIASAGMAEIKAITALIGVLK